MFILFRLYRKDEISFDTVAETGNIVAKNGNNVEATFDIVKRIDNVASTFRKRNFVLSTMSKQTEHVQFVSTLSKGRNFTIESFDIVAVCGNKVECCFDKVERCFDNVACCFDIVAGVDLAFTATGN